MSTKYNSLTIICAGNGWIVKEKGKLVKVFVSWPKLVSYIEYLLTEDAEEDSSCK